MLVLNIFPGIGVGDLKIGMSREQARIIAREIFPDGVNRDDDFLTSPPVKSDLCLSGVSIIYDDDDCVEVIEIVLPIVECYLGDKNISGMKASELKAFFKDSGIKTKLLGGVHAAEALGIGFKIGRKDKLVLFYVFRVNGYGVYHAKYKERAERGMKEFVANLEARQQKPA